MLDTGQNTLAASQLCRLEEFGGRIKKFGVNFAVFESRAELVLLCEGERFKSSKEQLTEFTKRALDRSGMKSCSNDVGLPVQRFGDNGIVLAVVLKSARSSSNRREAVATALIDMGDIPSSLSPNVSCNTDNTSPVQTESQYFVEMLGLLAEKFQAEAKAEKQIEMVGTELAQTYEELVLLHRLSTNMKVTEADSNFLQMACDSLTEIVSVEGIAILLEKSVDDERPWGIASGSGLIDIDEQTAAILHSRLTA